MVATLRQQLAEHGLRRLDAVVVLGSGMSECFAPEEYHALMDGGAGVLGHAGRLVLLRDGGRAVLVSLGRRHLYEGVSAAEITAPIVAAAAHGARTAILANAAGGLNPQLRTGSLMLIDGCLGTMLGSNGVVQPAVVDAAAGGGPRLRCAEPFSGDHNDAVHALAVSRGLRIHRGIYAGVPGPSYETRAEIRMLRRMGADVVGMSTVLESAVAAAHGLHVVGISLVTNMLSDAVREALSHEDVVYQGQRARQAIRAAVDTSLDCLHPRTG